MPRYVSILRGINVGGKRKLKMAALKSLYEKLGFKNVESYIQSGNLAFDVGREEKDVEIARKISSAIEKSYGYDVPVVVRTEQEMEQSIESNPFLQEQGMDPKKLHLAFLAQEPDPNDVQNLSITNQGADRYHITGKDIFICCEGKFHETKLSNNVFEKKLKVTATTRNWKTVEKLYDMAKQ